MPRKRKGRIVSVELSKSMFEQLDQKAQENFSSRSSIIKLALKKYFDQKK